MPIVFEAFAFCSTPGCGNGDAAGLEARNCSSAAEATRRLRSDMLADGWITVGRKHYCSDCARDRKGSSEVSSLEK